MLAILQNLDWSILHWIHSALSCGVLDFLMPKISALGDVGAIWLLAAALMLDHIGEKDGARAVDAAVTKYLEETSLPGRPVELGGEGLGTARHFKHGAFAHAADEKIRLAV